MRWEEGEKSRSGGGFPTKRTQINGCSDPLNFKRKDLHLSQGVVAQNSLQQYPNNNFQSIIFSSGPCLCSTTIRGISTHPCSSALVVGSLRYHVYIVCVCLTRHILKGLNRRILVEVRPTCFVNVNSSSRARTPVHPSIACSLPLYVYSVVPGEVVPNSWKAN